MNESLPTICLAVGLLLAVTGCGSVESESQPPRIELVEPAPSVADEQIQEPVLLEPEDDQTEAVTVTSEPATVPPDEMDSGADKAIAEPNATPLSEATPTGEPLESAPLEEAVAPEPKEARIAEPIQPLADAAIAPGPPPESKQADEDQPEALASFYEGYGALLQEHVLEDGRVDYQALRRKRLRLKQLLSEPDELDPKLYQEWPEQERLAFWINTYNLKVLEIIARNYPIQSSWWLRLTWPPSDIRHLGAIWSDYRFMVMDEEFTLGEVEKRFLRKTFRDPRAYLAITYATRSGPVLRRTPYRGEKLDQQLDEQVRAFLARDMGFRIDRDKAVVYLSALFEPNWHGKDFVGRYATQKKFKSHPPETRAVLNFLIRYLPKEDVYFLEVENYTLTYVNFDWRLNDRARGY